MTNPAEKILQVVEDTAAIIYDKLDVFENLAAAEEMTKYVSRQMLDAIISEMENDIRHKDSLQATVIAEQCAKLKEARTSLTNTNDS